MPRVLMISKRLLDSRLCADAITRLVERDVLDRSRIDSARHSHEHTLAVARAALHGCEVIETTVDGLRPDITAGCDLILAIGGDGTVLTAASLGASVPLITVNSDPGGSIGMFARTDAHGLPALIAAWQSGTAASENIPRLAVRVEGGPTARFLNDCLIASANPAAMTRYQLEVDGRREHQRSSGVWVATAAGSTAAIHSAGMASLPPHRPALLYKVREPFQGHGMTALREGLQTPPVGLRIIPAMPDCTLYIDGPHQRHELAAGTLVEIVPCQEPLRLLRLA